MSRLLAANFMRLKKDKFFWIGFIFMFAVGIFFPVKKYMDAIQTNSINNIDDGFFGSAVFINVIMSIFCSLFVGTEYSDGTIRNKIIVGQKRTMIYLTNVITSSIVSLIMCITFTLPYLCLGIPLLGFFTTDMKVILLTGLAVMVLAVAFSSIFTFIAMLCQNKATTAVFCMLLALGFFVVGASLNEMLDAPKMISEYSLTIDGSLVNTEVPNPRYLEGIKREIIQTLYDIIPGGQAIQCGMLRSVNLPRLPFYSIGLILLTTGTGVALFRKRDLR